MALTKHYPRHTRLFLFARWAAMLVVVCTCVRFLCSSFNDRCLANAVQSEDLAGTIRALRRGADPNANCYSFTGVPDAILSLLDNDTQPHSVLFEAIVNADTKTDLRIVDALLRFGADPNRHIVINVFGVPDTDCYPITYFFATEHANWGIVRDLVAHGADTRLDRSAVLSEAVLRNNVGMVSWLIAHGADVNGDGSRLPMYFAVSQLRSDIVQELLRNGASVATFPPGLDETAKTWAQLAAANRSNNPLEYSKVLSLIGRN